jgi:hypothetical protein
MLAASAMSRVLVPWKPWEAKDCKAASSSFARVFSPRLFLRDGDRAADVACVILAVLPKLLTPSGDLTLSAWQNLSDRLEVTLCPDRRTSGRPQARISCLAKEVVMGSGEWILLVDGDRPPIGDFSALKDVPVHAAALLGWAA